MARVRLGALVACCVAGCSGAEPRLAEPVPLPHSPMTIGLDAANLRPAAEPARRAIALVTDPAVLAPIERAGGAFGTLLDTADRGSTITPARAVTRNSRSPPRITASLREVAHQWA